MVSLNDDDVEASLPISYLKANELIISLSLFYKAILKSFSRYDISLFIHFLTPASNSRDLYSGSSPEALTTKSFILSVNTASETSIDGYTLPSSTVYSNVRTI